MFKRVFVVFVVFVLLFQRPKVTNAFSGSQVFFEGSFYSTVGAFAPFFRRPKVTNAFSGSQVSFEGFFL